MNRRNFILSVLPGVLLMTFGLASAGGLVTRGQTEGVESFLQSFFADYMAETHAPGAVFTLVDADGPIILEGFGKHHYENGEPVDPNRHLYRIASITKNFTAVAIMQLVEQGLIDLDADVNQYLKHIQLEDRFDKPITVRNLLQHSSGIEEEFMALSLRSVEERIPMAEYFQLHPPTRTYPPGEYNRYTNRAYMFLGHLVEDISGEVYEDYIQRHILDPLGMSDTTSDLTPEQEPRLTPGVFYVDGEYFEQEAVTTVSRPSGDLISSARDMARYIAMFLNGGEVDGQRILGSETVRLMMDNCFSHHPEFDGSCLGFGAYTTPNGITVRKHGGYYGGWNADFVLFPEQGLGYFTASSGDTRYQRELLTGLIEPLFGESGDPDDYFEFSDTIDRVEDIEGLYRPQFLSGTHEKVLGLFNGDTEAKVEEGGVLRFGAGRFRQVKPLVFRNVETGAPLVFVEDENGRIVQTLGPTGWMAVHDRLSFWQTGTFQLRLLMLSLSLAALFALVFVIAQLWNWLRRKANPNDLPERTTVAGWMVAIACMVWAASWAVLWFSGFRDIGIITFGLTGAIKVFFLLNKVAAVVTILAALATIAYAVKPERMILRKIGLALGSLASLGLTFWTWYWNLL